MPDVPQPLPDQRLGGEAGLPLRAIPLSCVAGKAQSPQAHARRAPGLIAIAVAFYLLACSGSSDGHATRIQVSGTRFVHVDGRPFDWRGITAFRLLEMESAGRSADVDAYLSWAANQKLTVVRVLAMAKHLFELSPERGLAALDAFLSRASRHGLYVEIVALADTASFELDLPLHVRRIGAVAVKHPNAFIEVANEPYHSTQRDELHRGEYLEQLRREIPSARPRRARRGGLSQSARRRGLRHVPFLAVAGGERMGARPRHTRRRRPSAESREAARERRANRCGREVRARTSR